MPTNIVFSIYIDKNTLVKTSIIEIIWLTSQNWPTVSPQLEFGPNFYDFTIFTNPSVQVKYQGTSEIFQYNDVLKIRDLKPYFFQ